MHHNWPIYSDRFFSPIERYSELERQHRLRLTPIRWIGLPHAIAFQIAIAAIALTLLAIISGGIILPF